MKFILLGFIQLQGIVYIIFVENIEIYYNQQQPVWINGR